MKKPFLLKDAVKSCLSVYNKELFHSSTKCKPDELHYTSSTDLFEKAKAN